MQRRWIGGSVAVLAVIAAAAMWPAARAAAAASPASYTLNGSGTGLEITVGGTTLVAGTSSVAAGTGGPVHAEGSGVATPSATAQQQATAAAPGASQTKGQLCAQPTDSFPAPIGSVLQLGVACSTASAAESAGGTPSASASGTDASLSVGAVTALLPAPVTQGSTLAGKLKTVLGVLPPLPTTGLPLATVLHSVASSSGGSLTALLSATIGGSVSTISTSGSEVSVTSKDTGSRIELLDGLGAGGGPLLTVAVGRTQSSAGVDLASGHVTQAATAATVTVTVSPPAGTSHTVAVAPGASQSFLSGTPLQTTVAAGAATTSPGTGKGAATAKGVEIDLAQGVGATGGTGTGGILLDLGASTVSASAAPTPATAASTSQTAPSPPPASAPATLAGATTVHTGEPWSGPLPLALVTLSLLAGLGLVARRRLSSLVHLAGRTASRVARGAGPVSRHSAGPALRDLLRSPSGPGSGPAAPPSVPPAPPDA